MTTSDAPSQKPARPVAALVLMILGPFLLGCIIAPMVFSFLASLKDAGSLPAWLGSDLRFERVTSRCVMISALLLLVPAIRLAGLGAKLKADLTPRPARWTDLGHSVLIGCASMFAIYVGGWLIGAYRLGNDTGDLVTELGTILLFLIGAVFVGLFEESFFRGFLFGALRLRAGLWPAAVLAGAFFSSVHFLRPDAPGIVTDVTWRSGFDLVPYLFARFDIAKDWPSALTLFLMGVTLCLYYEKQGHLLYVIGLHGGWVWAMRLGGHYFDRNRDVFEWFFSRSDLISRGPVAILVILGFLFAALRMKPQIKAPLL
ncbi:MAG: CPBP family intramembrane glutamic endopeptidase [bacterium]